MDENKNVIDVESIMDEIRTNIVTSGADKKPLSFVDTATKQEGAKATRGDFYEAVQFISYNYELNPYQVYTGNPVKVFIKKAIRKVANFFVIPIVVQQNNVNGNVAVVAEAVREQYEEIQNMKSLLEEINTKIDKLSKN